MTSSMKNSSKGKKVYLIAIGGTGMASLAGLLKEKGYEVSGSELTLYPPMSDQLAELKIPVKTGWQPANLRDADGSLPDLVIVGNAVSKDNPEAQEVVRLGLPTFSMPQALGELFLREHFPIVIAGTHGKTTTCGLMAWILERTGQSPSFLIGGIVNNFHRSYQIGHGDYFVIEGDEYDSAYFDKGPKFLHYRPQMLILNPVEFDHADIYRDLNHVLSAFEKLLTLLPKEGLLVANWDSENVRRLCQPGSGKNVPCRLLKTGLHPEAELRAERINLTSPPSFDLILRGKSLGRVQSPLLGQHNLQNLLSVLGIALELGIPLVEIQEALNEFQGVKRRQEVLGVIHGRTLIEDFAHHPTAIRETLAAIRAAYPQGRLWALFEPRSNTTRRRVFQQEFVQAFAAADEVLLAPVYQPEKIQESERLDEDQLVQDLKKHGKKARRGSSIEAMVQIVAEESRPEDIICLMSNGSFGGIYARMIEALEKGPIVPS